MNIKTQSYFNRLKERYSQYGDNDSLMALAEVEQQDNRIRELAIYREQEKTQELIKASLKRYRVCVEKLTNPDSARKMTDVERAELFATMDWCKFTLDIVGETPEQAEKVVDDIIHEYAVRCGFIGDI